MNPTDARKQIVQTYHQTGNYCETARLWHTSPQLVRKWVRRYQQYGDAGLQDLPKTPKRPPCREDHTACGRQRVSPYPRRRPRPEAAP